MCFVKREYKLYFLAAALCFVVALLWYWLYDPLSPFLFGAVLAYCLSPVLRYLKLIVKSDVICIVLSLLIALCIMILFFGIITPVLLEQFHTLYSNVMEINHKISTGLLNKFAFFDVLPEYIQSAVRNAINEIPISLSIWVSKSFESWVWYTSHTAIKVLLVCSVSPFTAFYLLRDKQQIQNNVTALIPQRYQALLNSIAYAIDYVFVNFIRGQMLISGILTIYFIVCCAVFCFHAPIGLGIIMGLFSLIPYAGAVIIFMLVLVLALVKFSFYTSIFVITVIVGLSQLLDIFLLRPKFMGEKLGLHPVFTVMSILVSASLFGLIGMFLAIPLTVLLMMVIKLLVNKYKLSFLTINEQSG